MSRLPRPINMDDLGREPLFHYGSQQSTIVHLRQYRPLDLTAENWRKAYPHGTFEQWKRIAKNHLRTLMHYDPGPVDLRPRTLQRWETKDFIREQIEFNTAPWFRVPGYFYTPKNVKLPAPALVVMHEWGGPMVFGADRVCGEPVHELIREHRNTCAGGRALSDWFASQGYCVITIDAHHFGSRIPRGLHGIPDPMDPRTESRETLEKYQAILQYPILYLSVRQLNWAGTTWAGVNFGDDSRCVDYLLSRPEVDPQNIGVTGLSGGGWRTNMLAALDDRIKAAVPVGWMTTGDAQQAYNIEGVVGSFCLLPGVWNRMDVPDLIAMAAPKACLVVIGTEDALFPPKAQRESIQHIRQAYEWACCPERFSYYGPNKPHCYDADIQEKALSWLDRHLK